MKFKGDFLSYFLLISIDLLFIRGTLSSANAQETLVQVKAIDYDPYSNKSVLLPPHVFGVTDDHIQDLFLKEIENVKKEGPSNRFWPLLVDFLPKTDRSKPKNVVRPNLRRVFTRQAGPLDEVRQSPLAVKSHVQLAVQSSPNARVIDASSTIGLKVSEKLTNDLIGSKRFEVNPVGVLANFQAPNDMCPFKVNMACNGSDKFASFDGSCNNLASPWLGKAETPYKRYEQPTYEDRLNNPRGKSVSGNQLPNPRVISRLLFNENFQFDNVFTHLTAIFGQFLAHDITSASVSSDSSGRIVDCSCVNAENPSCMPISMPSNEIIMRMSCMRFTRSSAAFPTFDCRLGHREQLNLLTSFVDCTQVYGPNIARSRELRLFQGGQMKTSQGPNMKPYLPTAQDGACRNTDANVKCFAAGEGRTNENLALTSLHTLFLREHNRIARELSAVNPQWNDEQLFNNARKIIIGMMQHVVYGEWLPVIISWNNAALFDIVPLSTKSYFTGYNPSLNPSIANEFGTAAFRFGHTLIRTSLTRKDQSDNPKGTVELGDIIFRPVEAFNGPAGGIDSILLGLLNEPTSKYDTNFADSLQNHLFEVVLSDKSVIAIDLAATNINRGRDHGIATYNTMREKCGLTRATSFNDLQDSVSAASIQLLSNIYENVDDIDLYVGGLSETPVNGGVVGPTFACLIANQFKDLKRGDRFYYENGPSPTAFTLDQLNEIKKVTLSKLICNNFDVDQIQPNSFILPDASLSNQKVSCSWLPSVDFTKWKE